MDVDDHKKDEEGENVDGEESYEPGTTPDKKQNDDDDDDELKLDDKIPIHLMTRKGSIAVDHLDSLCMRNSIVVKKVYNDLKQVYDIKEDLDFEKTMYELRNVMDSIRNDTARLDETFQDEKLKLKEKEMEIEDVYKIQKEKQKMER
eukprot:410618_1